MDDSEVRVLVVGVGFVGAKYLRILSQSVEPAQLGVVDQSPIEPSVLGDVRQYENLAIALEVLRPSTVIVAVPPESAQDVAFTSLDAGARSVMVDKPVAIRREQLRPAAPAGRAFVGFHTHFAPGVSDLWRGEEGADEAHVTLRCVRHEHYYTGWRRSWATAGGTLHQQAIHGIAAACRVLGWPTVDRAHARFVRVRKWADSEDGLIATVRFQSGQKLTIETDVTYEGDRTHSVLFAGGSLKQPIEVRGSNMEAGTRPISLSPSHDELRREMLEAVISVGKGHTPDDRLFDLTDLPSVLEVIDAAYDAAGLPS